MADKNFKIQIILGSVSTAVAFLVCLFINKICALLVLLLGLFCIFVFAHFTKKRYDSIEKLNDNLSLICSGNYDIKISENFSLLIISIACLTPDARVTLYPSFSRE
jgi:hypothetical protein